MPSKKFKDNQQNWKIVRDSSCSYKYKPYNNKRAFPHFQTLQLTTYKQYLLLFAANNNCRLHKAKQIKSQPSTRKLIRMPMIKLM